MAYRAEIEVIAKGVTKVTQLQKNLNQLATQIDHLNGPGSLGDFNKQLDQAAKLMGRAQQGTVEEKRAIEQYVTALKNANGAQERTNRLIAEEIRQRDGATAALKRYNAAAVPGRQPGGSMAGRYLRPGSAVATTQSAVPFGPEPGAQFGSTTQFGPIGGPSSSILGGQSSLVGDRIERSLRAARELDEVYESIDRIAAKSVATENERVEALGKGTQEVVELANSYRNISGQTKTQKQLQNEIKRGIIETKKSASEEAQIRSRDYLKRLELAGKLGQERRNAMLLASREEETEKRINAVLERRQKQREKLKRRERFNEDLALGAGFPLLFGGGLGAVGGGVLGAVAGGGKGGFGLQILFSALGQQIDNFFAGVSEAATTVADSLGGTTETLDALGEAGIRVEQSLIDQVQSLEEAGRAVAAYDAVQKELTATYGERGLQALQTLKSANESAAESTSELNAVLQGELAPTFTLMSDLSGAAASGLAKIIPFLNAALNPFQGTPDPERARQVARQERIDAGVRQRVGQIQTGQTVDQLSGDVSSLQRQTEIARLNNDLTNDRVVLLKQVEIITKATSQTDALEREIYEDLNNKALKEVNLAKIKKIQSQQALDLANLELNVTNAVNQAAEKATREKKQAADAAERQAKADDRVAQRVQRQDTAASNRLAIANAQLAIARETSDLSRIDLKFDLDELKIRQRYANLASQDLSNEAKTNLGKALRVELETLSVSRNEAISGHMHDQFKSLMKINSEFVEILPQTTVLSDEFKSLANTINNEIINGIEGMIDGTKTLGQVASSMLKKIANQMLQMAIMGPQGSGGIAGTIFQALGFGSNPLSGFAPKMSGSFFDKPNLFEMDLGLPELGSIPSGFSFANGGNPPVGKASLVGEKGPELFVPKTAGTIIPNHALGGSANVTVNVDASGSSVEGSADEAAQLGQAIGVAVQQELIKQKRPGGLLAS